MATIDEHYALIAAAIEEVRLASIACLNDTGYLPDLDIQSKTSYTLAINGDVEQVVETPTIHFPGFKKIGVVTGNDGDIKYLRDLQGN